MFPHPSSFTLSRFADEGLPTRRARRVAAHLAACAPCRAEIAATRGLAEAVRGAPVPTAGALVWESIAARREAGARMILPLTDVRPAARGRWMKAAAAILVAAAVGVLARPLIRGAVAAEPSALILSPRHPAPNGTVGVEYRPIATLAEAPRLELLGRFLTRSAVRRWNFDARRPRGVVIASLQRGADGVFRGGFTVPDSAVFAEFSVSDLAGNEVDSDRGRFWWMVVAAPDGRASFIGLLVAARTKADPASALAAADSLAALYPDSAQSWAARVSTEGSSRVPNWLKVFDARAQRYAALDRAMAKRGTVSPGEMAAMASLAAAIEEPAAAERWWARLLATYPTDPLAVEETYRRAFNAPRDSAAAWLPVLERAWSASPEERSAIAELGMGMAMSAGDSAAIRHWLARTLALMEPGFYFWSPAAEPDAALRSVVEAAARRQVRVLLDDSALTRSLRSTRARDREWRHALAAGALGLLGQSLAYDREYRAALDTLDLAVRMTQGLCGFEYLPRYRARVELILGDTASAERDLAAAAAARSPRTGPFGDSAVILLGRRYAPGRWQTLVDSASIRERACTRQWAMP